MLKFQRQMIRITEGSYSSFKDKATDSQIFKYRDVNDRLCQGNVDSLKDWNVFQNKLKERGLKYRLISSVDQTYKDLLKNKTLKSPQEAYQRSVYLAKNGCYLKNVRTYFDLRGVKIPCLIRVDDHMIDFSVSEKNNVGFQCYICLILDDKGRKLKNHPSDTDIVVFESRLSTSNKEDIQKFENFANLVESHKKTTFNMNDLENLLGNITVNASIEGKIIMNATTQEVNSVLEPIADNIEREKLLLQRQKEEAKATKLTSVKYEDIVNNVATEVINKQQYQTFVIDGIKYASNDGLKTAYRVKSKGGVSKSQDEKIDIIRKPIIKKAEYQNNMTDIKDIKGEPWYVFDYNGDEYATNDDKIAYKIENGELTNQTLMIEALRKRKLIKLTEQQYKMVRNLFLNENLYTHDDEYNIYEKLDEYDILY